MSVYSGFATRVQESAYDNILYNVVSLLSLRLVKFYRGDTVEDEGFFKMLNSHNKQLKKMEKQKYLEPKYSPIVSNFLRKLMGNTEMSERSYSQKQFPKLETDLTIQVQPPSTKFIERQVGSQKTFSLDRIMERGKKRKSKKPRQKRPSGVDDGQEVWALKQQRMPIIQKFKFNCQQGSPDESRYNWACQMTKNIEMLRSGNMDKVQIHESNIKRITNGARFRSKLYFK